VDDDELQSRLVPALALHDREIRFERSALLESIELEALLAACHAGKSEIVTMINLTQSVNTILVGRGQTLQVSPETVGWKLRALGLRTEFIAGGRKGLALLDETRAGIHMLAAAYGVRTVQLGVIEGLCRQCSKLVIGLADAGTALRGKK
jgi:hypothetical protein